MSTVENKYSKLVPIAADYNLKGNFKENILNYFWYIHTWIQCVQVIVTPSSISHSSWTPYISLLTLYFKFSASYSPLIFYSPLSSISFAHMCTGIGCHPLEHGQCTVGYTIEENWLSLLQWPLTASSSSFRCGTPCTSSLSTMECWLA